MLLESTNTVIYGAGGAIGGAVAARSPATVARVFLAGRTLASDEQRCDRGCRGLECSVSSLMVPWSCRRRPLACGRVGDAAPRCIGSPGSWYPLNRQARQGGGVERGPNEAVERSGRSVQDVTPGDETPGDETELDPLDEASAESFPASDPPSETIPAE